MILLKAEGDVPEGTSLPATGPSGQDGAGSLAKPG